ncbi:hypothetical protein [Anaerotaenia torta]|uniref:hypothetical protein n=1 Tax=Anaerotaenia torta TaxID=433293 RepID=UPI003D2342AA
MIYGYSGSKDHASKTEYYKRILRPFVLAVTAKRTAFFVFFSLGNSYIAFCLMCITEETDTLEKIYI